MRHVIVIGRRPSGPSNDDTEIVASRITSALLIKERCEHPAALVETIAPHAKDGPIDLLDIFDHANAGVQSLGSGVLFQSGASAASALVGENIARALDPYLADHARVRLLGCRTAEGPAGRMLLFRLTRLLGRRRLAIGTIDGTDSFDFDGDGFMLQKEVTYLFDGVAAIDGEAPPRALRIDNYLKMLG